MKAGVLRLVLLGAATSLVLAGCGDDTTPADGSTPSAGASTSTAAGGNAGDGGTTPGAADGKGSDKGSGKGSGTGSGTTDGSASPSASPSGPGSSGGSDGSSTGSAGDGTGAGLEMPEEAPATVDSLSELLEPVGTAPLVTAPLPRAATAQGRLVARFPTVLRPVRSSRVGSSAISPSAGRLQASLVATSRLAPEQVLVAYRTRFAARGLVELSTPVTDAGSVAAAFERGRSTVTITATGAGARTSYIVHATLHVGGE